MLKFSYLTSQFLRDFMISDPFNLTAIDCALLRVLADFMDMSPKRVCVVPQERLARITRLSLRSIKQSLKTLQDKELIKAMRLKKNKHYFPGKYFEQMLITCESVQESSDKVINLKSYKCM